MYDEILLPVDRSDGATEAVRHAGALARWADAEVTALFVADTTVESVTTVDTDVVDALEREGEEIVTEAGDVLADAGVDYRTDVVQGGPAETIVEYAERYDFDLVAVSTHGRTGLSRGLLGSVAEKVVRLCPVPVLTTTAGETPAFPYHRVLVPTDGSAAAEAAERHAIALADALDATLHVLSVVEEERLGPDVRSLSTGADEGASDAVDEVAAAAGDRGVPSVVTHVEHGSPHQAVHDAVTDHDIRAVVMGTKGRRGLDRILLGSVAEKTVRTAPVPVVTVSGE